ncbi:MAG: osmotically-inducible protein OsmY [Mariniblastus sp.]|jgi:osmotically-inducible protein OsmY
MNHSDSNADSGQNPENQEASSLDTSNSESLESSVRATFDQLGYPQLNSIECSVVGDIMLLSGELSSFYLKQVAQSVAVKIPGVREVRNEIQVR